MLLTPTTARPWLGPDSRNRPWPGHGAMMVRRREALDALYPAFGSWARLGLGALAWALGTGGAVLVGRGVAEGGDGPASAVGIGLLLVGTVLGGVIVATGSALARAIAGWWTLTTAVRADGGRVDATPSDPDTRRLHDDAVARDRSTGRAELWRPPLLPRTLAVLLLAAGVVVLVVQAVLGYGEAATPYAADDVRGAWLTQVVAAVVCLLTALLTASGLRRVHRARMHRVAHDEPATPSSDVAALTPALGSGAIVAGGTLPPPGAVTAPPAWAGPPSVAPTEAAAEAAPAGASAPEPAAGTSAARRAPAGPLVRLSDGRELGPGVTLVGRAPRPRPDERVDALLAVADERVSKTHLTVRVEAGRVVVVDRGSTNGTVAYLSDGTTRELSPGEPHELGDGDAVVVGSTTVTVGEAGDDVEHTVLRHPAGS
ncbi:FHA domain-containing protein [Georgenia sp. H159]|uniref:FHA domain-containing protein n=1 Tax=Georgenia sp. H159 TaxID=3076115 RepID=UPI002D7930A7|nr:FHA domain-containing protein [Georgenia sp. H159]